MKNTIHLQPTNRHEWNSSFSYPYRDWKLKFRMKDRKISFLWKYNSTGFILNVCWKRCLNTCNRRLIWVCVKVVTWVFFSFSLSLKIKSDTHWIAFPEPNITPLSATFFHWHCYSFYFEIKLRCYLEMNINLKKRTLCVSNILFKLE